MRKPCETCGCIEYEEQWSPVCHQISWCHSEDVKEMDSLRELLFQAGSTIHLRGQHEGDIFACQDVGCQKIAKATNEYVHRSRH